MCTPHGLHSQRKKKWLDWKCPKRQSKIIYIQWWLNMTLPHQHSSWFSFLRKLEVYLFERRSRHQYNLSDTKLKLKTWGKTHNIWTSRYLMHVSSTQTWPKLKFMVWFPDIRAEAPCCCRMTSQTGSDSMALASLGANLFPIQCWQNIGTTSF